MIDPTPNPLRVALAHDWLVGLRGGEWVLDRLARLFGPTDLYTLVDNGRPLTDAISKCRVITSPLQHFPGAAGRMRRAYLPLYPWAVEQLRVGDVRDPITGTHAPPQLLISTSSAVMKSIRPPDGVPHICYCHSPARYIWGQTDDYRIGRGGWWRDAGLRAIRKRFQAWDRRTAARVTHFLANSRHVAARIRQAYDRDAEVVYPPVRTEFFTHDPGVQRSDFLLVVGALEPYKRTDVVIRAAAGGKWGSGGGWPLVIAGKGSQRAALEQLAKDLRAPVTFRGRVSDAELRDLYQQAAGLIFPQEEDFGIIAVEAQAAGCPVIAYAKGGGLEIVTNDTGILVESQTPEAFDAAVRELRQRSFDPRACRANAERFSEAVFDSAITAIVRSQISPV